MVDPADVLIDAPGQLDVAVGVTVGEVLLQACALTVGEVLGPGQQGAANPVERVVLLTAPAQGDLLDTAADLVEGELDDVERIEDSDGVWQFVTDGVGVATERVQRGVFDAHGDLDALLDQPVGVDPDRTALDGVEKSGSQASISVADQVDHHRDGLVDAADL